MKENNIDINTTRKSIGERIEHIRIEKGMSKEEFARLINMTGQQIGDIIRGKCGFSTEKLIEISNKTGYSSDYILMGIDKQNIINTKVSDFENKLKDLNSDFEIIKKYII